MIYKTLRRKLNIEQEKPHKKQEGYLVPAPLVNLANVCTKNISFKQYLLITREGNCFTIATVNMFCFLIKIDHLIYKIDFLQQRSSFD
jgi:hypothetical protein